MIYNIVDLRLAYNAGEKFKFLFFWGHTSPDDGRVDASCLSQWFPCRFEVDGMVYSCAEQYMMAEKSRIFKDEEMLAAIMAEKHPKKMKEYGRAVKNFDKDVWDNQCYELVRTGNLAKFHQNREIMEFLTKLKGRILVEASPYDRIWGIGMGRQNPDAENPMKWKGANLLGFALTEVRDILLKKNVFSSTGPECLT